MLAISTDNILSLSKIFVVLLVILSRTTGLGLDQQQQQQKTKFDIVPGTLVYFNSDSSKAADFSTFHQNFNSYVNLPSPYFVEEKTSDLHHDHARHYSKGNLRRIHFRKKQFDNAKNARRQGQQCPGVCRYIPDRDVCSTHIVPVTEESQAYDEDDEDYYSDEKSVEESSEEYYDDDEEETEGSDHNKFSSKSKKTRKIEPRRKLTEPRIGVNETSSVVKTRFEDTNGGDGLYVVYPSLTKFAVSRAQGTGRYTDGEEKGSNAMVRRNRMPARRKKRRQRRPSVQSPVKLRPSSGLEQEILIRWDRVVERGPFIGGDIIVPDGVFLRPPNFRFLRKHWQNGEIPYTMDPSLNSCRQGVIYDAMDEIEDKTCIRFIERENERNYIDIRRAVTGCSSYVGMVGGAQHLNLSTGCFSKFTITHELMHAIGFDHEQSRKDRDKHIDIDFDNVLRHKEGQFELNPSLTGAGFPYDIRSIMHYSAFLFAKDKCEPTIYPVNEKIDICELGIGNGKGGMTDCDAAKVNKMYKCTGRKYPKKCKVKK